MEAGSATSAVLNVWNDLHIVQYSIHVSDVVLCSSPALRSPQVPQKRPTLLTSSSVAFPSSLCGPSAMLLELALFLVDISEVACWRTVLVLVKMWEFWLEKIKSMGKQMLTKESRSKVKTVCYFFQSTLIKTLRDCN